MSGIVLLLLIPLWMFLVVPELEKIGSYENKWILMHDENNRFEIDGLWAGNHEIKSFWNEEITKGILETEFVVGEGENIVYEVKNKFFVDRKTRHNLAGETDKKGEAYSIFPLHLKKQDYKYWPAGYGQSINLNFMGIEKFYGLETYHLELADGFSDDTIGYEFLELVPEKYKVLSDFNIHVYVEPVSGIVVNYEDEGISYYADSSGNKVQDISEWGNRFDYYSVKSQAEIAKSAKLKIEIYEIYIPLLLGLMGLVLLGLALVRKKK